MILTRKGDRRILLVAQYKLCSISLTVYQSFKSMNCSEYSIRGTSCSTFQLANPPLGHKHLYRSANLKAHKTQQMCINPTNLHC